MSADNLKITKILKGIQLETTIKAPASDVFKYWFEPPQFLPPLKSVLNLDYRIGGTFQTICMGADGSDIILDCIFRNIVVNKELVFEWRSSKITCQVSNKYIPGSTKDSTYITARQTILGAGSDPETEEMANRFIVAYVSGMKAVFEKMKK